MIRSIVAHPSHEPWHCAGQSPGGVSRPGVGRVPAVPNRRLHGTRWAQKANGRESYRIKGSLVNAPLLNRLPSSIPPTTKLRPLPHDHARSQGRSDSYGCFDASIISVCAAGVYLQSLYSWDPATLAWTQIIADPASPWPSARAHLGFAAVHDGLYLFGGEGPEGEVFSRSPLVKFSKYKESSQIRFIDE